MIAAGSFPVSTTTLILYVLCENFCSDASRCEECTGRAVHVVEGTCSYQPKLECRCSISALFKQHSGVSASGHLATDKVSAGDTILGAEWADSLSLVDSVSPSAGDTISGAEWANSLSSVDSVSPQDSASQSGPLSTWRARLPLCWPVALLSSSCFGDDFLSGTCMSVSLDYASIKFVVSGRVSG